MGATIGDHATLVKCLMRVVTHRSPPSDNGRSVGATAWPGKPLPPPPVPTRRRLALEIRSPATRIARHVLLQTRCTTHKWAMPCHEMPDSVLATQVTRRATLANSARFVTVLVGATYLCPSACRANSRA
jgi:hypothetical protein